MNAPPVILAVVLNYRTAEMTKSAVDAALVALDGFEFHLMVVDNDSGDGSFEELQLAAAERNWGDRVTVVQSGANDGFGAGNNFGIQAGLARMQDMPPDFVYVLNSDAFPERNAVRALVDALGAQPDIGIAGSYIQGDDGVPHRTAFRFPSVAGDFEGAARIGIVSRLLKRHIMSMPVPDETCEVDWLAGASMMIRREVLEAVGMFDEVFFLYYEETDLCLRAARAGWKTLYVRDSTVVHIGSVSTGMKTWVRMPRYWFDSRRYYFTMNHGRPYAVFATVAHVAGSCLWRVWRVLTRKPRRDPDHFLSDLIVHDLTWRPPSVRRAPDFSQYSTLPCKDTSR